MQEATLLNGWMCLGVWVKCVNVEQIKTWDRQDMLWPLYYALVVEYLTALLLFSAFDGWEEIWKLHQQCVEIWVCRSDGRSCFVMGWWKSREEGRAAEPSVVFVLVLSGSSSSSKYDPEILKAEIATTKSRVSSANRSLLAMSNLRVFPNLMANTKRRCQSSWKSSCCCS